MVNPAIAAAIKFAGSRRELATRLNVTQEMVRRWLFGISPITAEKARDIERVTEAAVTREQLRPDLFGPIALTSDSEAA